MGPFARSRESLRRGRSRLREWKLCQCHAHFLRSRAAIGARDGAWLAARLEQVSNTLASEVGRMNVTLRFAIVTIVTTRLVGAQAASEWPVWGGDAGATKFSTLTDIHRGNVAQLTRAWEWATGETPNATSGARPGNFQATPLMIGDTLFLS